MNRQVAVLGGGCFWCLEAVYLELEGVVAVESGYAGGHVANPSYEQVCQGDTGHAEVVRVEFDADRVGFDDLLRVFFSIHDPTTRDRQGADVGPQYRSAIFCVDDAQLEQARRFVDGLEAGQVFGAPIVTDIVPLERFWPAEACHQRYFERNPYQGYCRVVVAPKVEKFRHYFAAQLKRG